MNPRVLELIKNPKNIQFEDLGLLKEEIHAFPYIQNIRALHLYGVHLYEKENYQKELSTTAAYTTDKKILYQLINGKIKQEPKPEPIEEKQPSKTADKASRYTYKGFPIKREEVASAEPTEEACPMPVNHDVKHIYVNGERNRILFEGEENFLEEENTAIIDLESTLESGTLVTQKAETTIPETAKDINEGAQPEVDEHIGAEFTPETIINEDLISTEAQEEKVEDKEDVSFHETETLLPEINIEENISEGSLETERSNESEDILPSGPEDAVPTDAELSFHKTEEFLPDVRMQVNNEEVTESAEISQLNVNKHEEEMRRLIEEVEKKMKETKPALQEKEEEPEPVEDHEISFADTQNFHFWSTEKEEVSKVEEVNPETEKPITNDTPAPVEALAPEIVENVDETAQVEVQTAWKPMSVESNLPDSLINKPAASTAPVNEVSESVTTPDIPQTEVGEELIESEEPADTEESSHEETKPVTEENKDVPEEQSEKVEELEDASDKVVPKEEAPVMNVSFFTTDISTLKVEEKEKESKEEPVESKKDQEPVVKNTPSPADSNVPGFINTWQSWLKIDRTEEMIKEKEVIKEKAIETFIENNPRISQLKEESSYVVKEKNDDISHLMTETLANLYFEQKLYTKAIKAFEILIKKNPEKKKYFESKIQEIKDFRSKN